MFTIHKIGGMIKVFKRSFLAMFLTILIIGLLAGCMGSSGSSADGKIEYDREDKNTLYKSYEGNDGKTLSTDYIRDTFPDYMPVPEGGKLIEVKSHDEETEDTYEGVDFVTYFFEESQEDLIEFYESEFSEEPFNGIDKSKYYSVSGHAIHSTTEDGKMSATVGNPTTINLDGEEREGSEVLLYFIQKGYYDE